MRLPSLWSGPQSADPFRMMRREIDDLFSDFAQRLPMAEGGGLRAPAINVAETEGAIEITAELPGVDQKDIKLSIEGKRVILSGEKKEESQKDEKGWHVMERSYGSFRRSIDLPFEPKGGAVDANFENGVLYLTVKKPPAAEQQQKTIEIKAGAPKAISAGGAAAAKPEAQKPPPQQQQGGKAA
jgi:HSP20 family protein